MAKKDELPKEESKGKTSIDKFLEDEANALAAKNQEALENEKEAATEEELTATDQKLKEAAEEDAAAKNEDAVKKGPAENAVPDESIVYSKDTHGRWSGLTADLELASEVGRHLFTDGLLIITDNTNEDGSVTKEVRLKK